VLERALRLFVNEPKEACARGKVAREFALSRYGLERFLSDWDEVLMEVAE
jgi:hypothetical protein